MKIEEVPQDQGMMDDGRHEVCYAVDDAGRYVLTDSAGWEPKNIANSQAWGLIDAKAEAALARVKAGTASALAYHMARHQMGYGLLAHYAGWGRFRVWLHTRPGPFSRLSDQQLQRYAEAFDIPVDELTRVPDKHRSRSSRKGL